MRTRRHLSLADALVAMGALFASAGCFLLAPAFGLTVAGAFLAGAGMLVHLRREDDQS